MSKFGLLGYLDFAKKLRTTLCQSGLHSNCTSTRSTSTTLCSPTTTRRPASGVCFVIVEIHLRPNFTYCGFCRVTHNTATDHHPKPPAWPYARRDVAWRYVPSLFFKFKKKSHTPRGAAPDVCSTGALRFLCVWRTSPPLEAGG